MIEKVISGGQTGVDRTALEVAKELGIPTGGTAPKAYRTENGSDYSLKSLFGLAESPYTSYPPRTEQNIKDSDGTVLFGVNSSGTMLMKKLCAKYNKPSILNPTPAALWAWIEENNIYILNVAGNRLSYNLEASIEARKVLWEVLSESNIYTKTLSEDC